MKKSILTLALASLLALLGTASADRTPRNLTSTPVPCLKDYTVSIAKGLTDVSPTLKTDLLAKMRTRLAAYKVLNETCVAGSPVLSVTLDGFKLNSGAYAYVLTLAVYDTVKFPDWASVWSTTSYGTTGQVGSKMAQDFASSAVDLVDDFAADYNTANP